MYHVFPSTFHVLSRKINYRWDSVQSYKLICAGSFMIKDLSLALDPIFLKRIKIKTKKREKRLFFFIMLTINYTTNLPDRRKEENTVCITILRFIGIYRMRFYLKQCCGVGWIDLAPFLWFSKIDTLLLIRNILRSSKQFASSAERVCCSKHKFISKRHGDLKNKYIFLKISSFYFK